MDNVEKRYLANIARATEVGNDELVKVLERHLEQYRKNGDDSSKEN